MRQNLTDYLKSKNAWIYGMVILIHFISIIPLFATVGDPGVHDPSTVVKSGNKYYTFTTGGNVPMKSSPDLISWKSEGSIFSSFPSWIKTYAPDFNGNFWAPDVIFMNNKYYVYYSCFNPGGDAPAAIGLVTNPTLDKSSPNYKWTDQGMVVFSATKKDIVAIDPSIYKDPNGRVFMAYGTYPGNGMGIVELDPITGKVKAGDKISRVSHNSEAAGLIKVGNYYYLFHNHGSCCSGTNSTYYITCGRSTNPKGPYLDANGGDMAAQSYGTDVIKRSGKYYGPGHFALFKENGIEIVSYHYYDADNGGRSKIGFGKLIFVNGWPKVTRDWFENESFSIVGSESGKAWEVNTGTGAITQNTPSKTNTAQKWNFTKQGEGIYTITAANNGKVAEIAGCANTNGAKLQLGSSANTNCQKYFIERTATGTYVIEPVNSINATTNAAKMIGVTGNATSNGASLETRDYNGAASQRWTIVPFGTITGLEEEQPESQVQNTTAFPNPFTNDLTICGKGDFEYHIYDVTGNEVEKGLGNNSKKAGKSLLPGIYLIKVSCQHETSIIKITKN